jgi:hypothetical protein
MVMLSAIRLSVAIMLSIVMLNVVMLRVVVPMGEFLSQGNLQLPTAWVWQHDKTSNDDDKMILNCMKKLMKNTARKRRLERPKLKSSFNFNFKLCPDIF